MLEALWNPQRSQGFSKNIKITFHLHLMQMERYFCCIN